MHVTPVCDSSFIHSSLYCVSPVIENLLKIINKKKELQMIKINFLFLLNFENY